MESLYEENFVKNRRNGIRNNSKALSDDRREFALQGRAYSANLRSDLLKLQAQLEPDEREAEENARRKEAEGAMELILKEMDEDPTCAIDLLKSTDATSLQNIERELLLIASEIGTAEHADEAIRVCQRMATHHIHANLLRSPCIVAQIDRIISFRKHHKATQKLERQILKTAKKMQAILRALPQKKGLHELQHEQEDLCWKLKSLREGSTVSMRK